MQTELRFRCLQVQLIIYLSDDRGGLGSACVIGHTIPQAYLEFLSVLTEIRFLSLFAYCLIKHEGICHSGNEVYY